MRTEGSCQEIPMKSSGIEPATFGLVAKDLNRLRHRVPPYIYKGFLATSHVGILVYSLSLLPASQLSALVRRRYLTRANCTKGTMKQDTI
jgi:hypothetical protein